MATDKDALDRMESEWDERARKNARHFVATGQEEWTDAEFFASGEASAAAHILPDMEILCNGRVPSSMRVLEIGCGAGRTTMALSGLFGEVHGIDISGEMVRRARAALQGKANVHLYKTNGKDLRIFDDATFDFIYSEIVLQHIPRKAVIISYIEEAFRVLKPDAVFKFQLQGYPIPEKAANTWVGVGFSEEEMRSLAARIGFRLLSLSGAGTQLFWLTLLKPGKRGEA